MPLRERQGVIRHLGKMKPLIPGGISCDVSEQHTPWLLRASKCIPQDNSLGKHDARRMSKKNTLRSCGDDSVDKLLIV